MNTYHQANQTRWEVASVKWKAMHDQRGDWKIAHQQPEIVFWEQELQFFKNIVGKKVAVLGSGDNLAVFALAGLGAKVTSSDIAHNQLKVAAERAEYLGLDIEFVQADVTDLSVFEDESFDMIYTGGHVAVWVSDLEKYYKEAVRILKKDGLFLVNEYHPFRRIWKQGIGRLEVHMSYYDNGPFKYEYNDDVLEPQKGDLASYEFHWRVSDFIMAMLKAGCELIFSDEMGTHVGDWEGVPLEGLPEWLFLVGKKKH